MHKIQNNKSTTITSIRLEEPKIKKDRKSKLLTKKKEQKEIMKELTEMKDRKGLQKLIETIKLKEQVIETTKEEIEIMSELTET